MGQALKVNRGGGNAEKNYAYKVSAKVVQQYGTNYHDVPAGYTIYYSDTVTVSSAGAVVLSGTIHSITSPAPSSANAASMNSLLTGKYATCQYFFSAPVLINGVVYNTDSSAVNRYYEGMLKAVTQTVGYGVSDTQNYPSETLGSDGKYRLNITA
ncbi:hypothetical protein [Oscillibacter sp.]|uniref:hypothetical protein n=1 Tax=Oscillibacter sp. TaxID=1945593 RepID=UPI003395B43E